MSKTRSIETINPHEKELEQILFFFIDDEKDYNSSDKEINEIIIQHTLKAFEKVKEIKTQMDNGF